MHRIGFQTSDGRTGSRIVVDLVAGPGLSFAARGEHALKGAGAWGLFAVEG